jgi:hypothetical protein
MESPLAAFLGLPLRAAVTEEGTAGESSMSCMSSSVVRRTDEMG